MEYKEYLKKIISFNNDKDLVALREKYNEPSFFEIISKERSETTYSAFLKWLFLINSTRSNSLSPIMSLLDILVKRCSQQNDNLIDDGLKEAILSRKLIITGVSVETEKIVSQLAQNVLDTMKSNNDSRCAFLKDVVNYCQDRIDIFIECDVIFKRTNRKLQIIIENKIDSKEGGAKSSTKKRNTKELTKEYEMYLGSSQTIRYHEATYYTNSDILQLYAFLTPLSSSRLDDFEGLKREQEQYDKENKDKKVKTRVLREDENFIQINYQDILDDIVVPLLNSSVSDRTRFFLEEFKNELAFPNIDSFDEQSCIAISKDVSETMTNYWTKYHDLIVDAIIATSGSTYYTVKGIYYKTQPRQIILKALIDSDHTEKLKENEWISDVEKDNYNKLDNKYWYKKGKNYKELAKMANSNQIDTKEITMKLGDKTKSLLKSFLDENSSFIYAILNGVKEGERKKYQCLMDLLSKKNSTKYTLFYDGKKIGSDLGYGATAYAIIKCWAQQHKNKDVTIKDLNDKFPRTISNYYERGKWFQNLIYRYNSNGDYYYDDQAEGKADYKFDVYKTDKNNAHNFEINNGERVIVLRMWHEDDVENLIKHITDYNLFDDKLEILRS